jgi:hypothetical protein
MMTIWHRMRQLWLVVVLAVSLVASSFAHQMPGPQDSVVAELLAAGATLSDLCADGQQPQDGPHGPNCLACQIVGTADLPSGHLVLIDVELAFVARVVAPRESRALARELDPARSPQGPPAA